jgi:hypothetical protein
MATTAPAFVFDLPLLEANSIIRKTPSWADVDAARQRLSQLRELQQPYEQMEQDRDLVLQYADILGRSRDTIGYAICLAVDLARYSLAPGPRERFGDALRALSDGLDLRVRDEADTRAELLRCFRTAFPERPPTLLSAAAATPPPAAADWISALQVTASEIQGLPPQNINDVRQRAWNTWHERLIGFNSGTDVPVDIDYLRCRVKSLDPGTILLPALRSLQLNEWSDAYIRASRISSPSDPESTIPLWFAYGALGALGFDLGPELESITTTVQDSREIESTKRFLGMMPPSPPQKGVLIIRVKAGSITDRWTRPSRQLPGICVTEESFANATRIGWTYFQSRLHGVLFEAEPTETPAATLARAGAAQVLLKLPRVRLGLLTRVARSESLPSGFTAQTAVAPADLAAASAQAFDVSPVAR